MIWILIYILGYFLSLVILGIFEDLEDVGFSSFIIHLFWPVILVAIILFFVCGSFIVAGNKIAERIEL